MHITLCELTMSNIKPCRYVHFWEAHHKNPR